MTFVKHFLTGIFPCQKGGEDVEYLTIKEAADLKGCSGSYISRLVKNKKIDSINKTNPKNGQSCYMIPLSALPE